MKQRIKELLVVEGKHDEVRLKNLFDCDVLTTGGLGLNQDTLDVIAQASEKQGVIVITDPDHPGRVIRDRIAAYAPKAKHIFIEKKDAIGKRNVGVEYVSDELLLAMMENIVTLEKRQQTITQEEYVDFALMGDAQRRDYLSSALKLGKCNNKRLFRYLNMMGIEKKQVEEILEDYDRNHL